LLLPRLVPHEFEIWAGEIESVRAGKLLRDLLRYGGMLRTVVILLRNGSSVSFQTA
jgi:hypothetical protein